MVSGERSLTLQHSLPALLSEMIGGGQWEWVMLHPLEEEDIFTSLSGNHRPDAEIKQSLIQVTTKNGLR